MGESLSFAAARGQFLGIGGIQKGSQLLRHFGLRRHVGKGVGVELVQEGALCFGKDTLEAACGGDLALPANSGVAVDDNGLALAEIDDVTQADLVRGFGEAYSAATSTLSLQETMADEVLANFGDVVDREVVGFGDLPRRHETIRMQCDIDQTAVEEIRVGIYFHKYAKTLPISTLT